MARAEGMDSGHRGQHRAGKHTKQAKAHEAKQPRVPKGKSTGVPSGTVYNSTNAETGPIGRLFGKKKKA